MKKEGIILVFFLVLFMLSSLVFARDNAGGLDASQTGPVATGTYDEKVNDNPQAPEEASGYWIVYARSPGSEPGSDVLTPYYPSTIADNTVIGSLDTDPNTRVEQDSDGWDLDYSTMYSDYRIPDGSEIVGAKFALDMWLHYASTSSGTSVFDENDIFANLNLPFDSHGYILNVKSDYQGADPVAFDNIFTNTGECINCLKGDNVSACTYDSGHEEGFPAYGTCIYVNVLNRDSCEDFADIAQPFCEGIANIGENSGDLLCSDVGKPGFGGCGSSDNPNPGRDWYTYGTKGSDVPNNAVTDTFFSNVYLRDSDFPFVGDCCGNDPQDIGVIRPKTDGSFYKTDLGSVMCLALPDAEPGFFAEYSPVPLPSDVPSDYVYLWQQADKDYFRIRKLNRSGLLFDAVSNNENWFVCNASLGSDSLDDFYMVSSDSLGGTPGPLVPEFGVLPKPSKGLNYGTTVAVEGSEGPDAVGEGIFSDTDSDAIATDVADQSSFADDIEITGPAFSNPCDKDGDGFNGDWTSDSGAGPRWDNLPGPKCENPEPPFECISFDGVNMDLDSTKYPGAPLICDEITGNSDNNCNGIADTEEYCISDDDVIGDCPVSDYVPEDCKVSAMTLSERFTCFQEEVSPDLVKGSFSECCGFNLEFCHNPFPAGRREGSFVKTLREFYDFPSTGSTCSSNDTNCVLKYGISTAGNAEDDESYTLSFSADYNDIDIRDWSDYKYLEFYIYYAANFHQNIRVGKLVGNPNSLDGYVYYFDEPIVKYAVNEPQLGKWLHIVIPLNVSVVTPMDDVDIIVFYTKVKDIREAGTIVYAKDSLGDSPFSNVIGVDKIHLTGYGGDRYCSGVIKSTWIDDLDNSDSSIGVPEKKSTQYGRSACNSIPSYGWTGTECCGDDTGNDSYYIPPTGANTPDLNLGDSTFKEQYADSEAGCFGGNKIVDGQRATIVEYRLEHDVLGYDGSLIIQRTCTSPDECTYYIPQVPGLIIKNEHPLDYDLVLVSASNEVPVETVGPGTVLSPDAAGSAILKSYDVPMQLLYNKSKFVACHPSDYVEQLKSSIDGSDLVSSPYYSTCDVVGDYFCDSDIGENMGWSGESLSVYPLSDGFELEDGTLVETDTVKPNYRNYTKSTYNLIVNGGFERT